MLHCGALQVLDPGMLGGRRVVDGCEVKVRRTSCVHVRACTCYCSCSGTTSPRVTSGMVEGRFPKWGHCSSVRAYPVRSIHLPNGPTSTSTSMRPCQSWSMSMRYSTRSTQGASCLCRAVLCQRQVAYRLSVTLPPPTAGEGTYPPAEAPAGPDAAGAEATPMALDTAAPSTATAQAELAAPADAAAAAEATMAAGAALRSVVGASPAAAGPASAPAARAALDVPDGGGMSGVEYLVEQHAGLHVCVGTGQLLPELEAALRPLAAGGVARCR